MYLLNRMKIEKIKTPENTKEKRLLLLEEQLKRSYLLCLLYSKILNGMINNRNYTCTELAKRINRSRPQTHHLLSKLVNAGVIKAVPRQGNKYIYVPTNAIKTEELYKIVKKKVEKNG